MNRAIRAGLINFQTYHFQLKASFFHSTPVSERKRKSHWDYGGGSSRGSSSRRSNHLSRRYGRLHSKLEMLHNVSAYADHLFKSWQFDWDEYDSSARRSTSSWFRQDFQGNGFRRAKLRNKGTNFWNRGFQSFEDDDIDVEAIFSSVFGGSNRHFFYSFTREEPEWENSYFYSNRSRYTRNQRNQYEDEYESSNESDCSVSDMRSDREALELSASGHLSLEDVKNAYRACALKWHPDRHQGSSKVVAEEKFKACSAAYQSLCDKLALTG